MVCTGVVQTILRSEGLGFLGLAWLSWLGLAFQRISFLGLAFLAFLGLAVQGLGLAWPGLGFLWFSRDFKRFVFFRASENCLLEALANHQTTVR